MSWPLCIMRQGNPPFYMQCRVHSCCLHGVNEPALTEDAGWQGVVAFAPSFAYIAQLHAHWQATGLWERLSSRKTAFVEPRTASAVAVCLREYGQAALAELAPEQKPGAHLNQ